MQSFTLHTHTIGFDGKNSVVEMIDAAASAGFKTIGISNHFIVHPEIKSARMYKYAKMYNFANIYSTSFDQVIQKFIAHYNEIDTLQQTSKIKILRGMEVDFFNTPQWRDGFDTAIKILRPDYIIGSAHFVYHNGTLCNMHDIATFDSNTQNKALQTYWENVQNAAASGLFTWMAHLDLPKKMGLGCDKYWHAIQSDVLDTITRTKTGLEINTSMYRPTCDEPYPSPAILKMAVQKNIPVIISDDAHNKDQIGRNFDRAEKLALNCGVTRFIGLADIIHKKQR
ncbi:MAG: histidinol-phosphatase HisJ family protein [Alphaproteobacteria bacterium]|nr:histidinol-phosphatase HisJ family protein [Alphaproteobacteria bacterium]